jgi:hypothetical protein
MDGGVTSLDNLVLLCRRHHRAVHEGEFALRQVADGTAIFLRPNGMTLEAVPTLPAPFPRLDAIARTPGDTPVWDGTPSNLAYAIDVLYAPSLGAREERSSQDG